MEKIGKYTAIAVAIFFLGYFGAAVGNNVEIRWRGTTEIGTVDFVTIVLSALSVMLVILTIFLAVLGFIGYSTINERLEEHSKNYFNEELQEGKPTFDMLKEVVRDVIYRGIDPIIDEPWDDDEGENGAP